MGPSLAPTGLTATAVGRDRIDLSWTAPIDDGGSAITGYRIESSADGSAGWADLVANTGSAATIYSHTGLMPNTTLHYRVSAINGEGTSDPSGAANATTENDVMVNFDPDTVTREVNENTGANQNVGSPVTATYTGTCTLTYALGGADDDSFEIDSSTGQIKTRSGVTYDHEAKSTYTVTVTAYHANCGTATATVTINVNDVNEPPRVPLEVVAHAVPRIYDQLFARWTPPENAGRPDITGYDIQYGQGSQFFGFSWRDGPQNVDGTSATISGLSPYSLYHVRVRAKNDEGSGPWSEPYFTTTNVLDFEVETSLPFIPDGLVPGDRFHLLFVTPPAQALKTILDDYYNLAASPVITLPETNPFQRYWRFFYPVASIRHIDARVITNTTYTNEDKGAPVYWVGGGKAADDYEDFYDGDWDDESARNVRGEPVPLPDGVWTGSTADGRELMDGGTSRALGESMAGYGAPGSTTTGEGPIYSGSTAANTEMKPIVGLSSVFRVVNPPLATNEGQMSDTDDRRSAMRSQAFTTGSNRHGYELSGVALGKYYEGDTRIETSIYSVDTNGHPDTLLFAFTNLDSYTNDTQAFNAPAGATLDPGATYAIVVQHATSGDDLALYTTASDDEDDESLDGWSIADAFHYESGRSWQTEADGKALKIIVRGIAKVGASLAPTGLTATAVGRDRIDLSWTAPTDDGGSAITGYRIESSADGSAGWADLVADTGSDATTYSHTGLMPNTTFHYRVSAINGEGASDPSGAANATTADYPAVTVSFEQAAYTVAEGETQSVTVTLSADPERTVVIPIVATPQGATTTDDYTVPTSVTFDAGDMSKTITFTATQDNLDDDGESVKLIFGMLPSRVSAGTTATTTVSITDDDTPPTASDGTVTTNEDTDHTFEADEFGYSDTDSDPLASVKVIELPAAGTGALTLNGTAITSADLPKTVTATELTENKLTYSPPANANGTGYASFKFKVNDGTEDSSSEYFITIDVSPVNDPATGAPTIRGTAQVGQTLTASTAGIDDVDGLPSAFTYQWKRYAADRITFEANIGTDSMTYTLTAAEEGKKVLVEVSFTDNGGSSEGPLVSALYPSSGTVVNLTVSFGETTYIVTENGTISVIVHLSADPERTVAIPITATPQDSASSADYSVPTSVTFNAGDMSKTITFTATQDAEDDDGESVLLAFGILPDGVNPGTRNETTVSITDDEAGVTIEPTALSVVAGRSNEYTVKLATEPTGDVTVTVSGHASTDVTPDKTTLTFTADNWDTAQTVTVSATQNAATAKVTLAHAVAGADYGSVTAEPVVVSVVGVAGQQPTLQVGVSSSAQTLTVPEGGANSYTLVLGSRPTGDVTVGVTLPAGTDLSLDKTSLTFTVDNWDDAQTVTVTAAEDDDGVTDAGVTLTHTVSGGSYGSTTVPDVEVSITENDSAGLVISRDNLTVGEGDAAGTSYTVTLATEPTGSVSVSITGQASTDLSLDKTTLTFTVDNWDVAQTVTVKAGQDDDGANDTATLTHTASGGDYASVSNTLPVTVTDDDTADIVLSETGVTVTEGDAAGSSYTVKLATQPSDTVIVTISGHDGTDLTLDKTTLTFTADNWDTAQTVTVEGGQDDDGSADTATLTHTASGGDYASVSNTLPVTVTDDDTAGVALSETGVTVTEGDAAGSSYTVALATQPSGSVSVSITGQASTDLSLDKTTLTFTVDNWATAQTVTVEAGHDNDAANDTATLTHTASGGDYAGITVDLPVTVTDDDTAGVTIEPTTLSVVAGRSNEYTVALATKPTGEVTVTISGHASTAVTLDKTTLTFTVGNWSMAQTVTVSAAQSASTGKVTLTHAVSGADYGSVSADSVVVSVVAVAAQQPTLQVGVSSSTQTLTVPEGGSNSYTLVLSSRPTGDVAIDVTLPAGTDLSLDKTSLTFTVDNWDDAQTVTVTAAEDDDGVTDAGVTLTHTISGGGYASTTVPNLEVSITENDTAGLVISKDSLMVGEGDATGSSYTVKLATEPSIGVSVAITGHAGTDLSLSGTTLSSEMLTFTVGNWDVAQTVTVTAGHDNDAANDTATLTHTASGADYANLTKDLLVTVTDNDTPAVTIEPTALSVVTGRTNKYSVKLATKPTGDVTVTISGHASTDVTPDNTTLTFTVGNWSMAQTVTVSAAQSASTGKVTLTHAVSGADYGSVSADSVVVSVVAVAAQQPTLQVGVSSSTQTLTVPEGGSNSYTLVLSSRPTGDVAIDVTLPAGTDLSLDKTSLTFTVDNWDDAQTVTVTAAEDDDGVTDAGVTLTHTISGGGYASTTVPNLEVSITENDTAGLVISKDSLMVGEGDATGSSYTVKLATEPSIGVSVAITGHAGTDLSLSGTTLSSEMLTFTVGNWDVAQTVTVTAGHDNDAANDTATLTHTASGADYANLTKDLLVTVTDNDTPAVTIEPTALSVVTGRTNKYSVKLATKPTGDVTVTISGHASTDVTPDNTTLTFTVGNWSMAQTVTVSAAQSASTGKVTLAHAVSGADYGSVSADSVVVSVVAVAGQQPTLQVGVSSSTQILTVPEGGSNSYALILSSRPTGDVAIGVTLPAGSDLTLSSDMLTFTVDNWDVAQTVTVTAEEDDDGVTDAAVTLTHTISGGGYGSTTVPDVEVSISENDTVGVTIEPAALSVVAGRSNEYTVALATEPTGEVTVTISGHASTDVTLDKTTLTFTVGKWSMAQTVTVSAAQSASTGKVTLAHAVSGADYGSVTAEPVVVSVVGRAGQQPTLQVGVSSSTQTLTVPEGGANSYTLVLGSRPTGDVTVGVTLPAGTGLSLDKTSLTFTMDNWDDAQTVAVTAAEDDDAVTDAGVTLTHTVSGGGYGSTTVPDVEVSITENDTAGVVISKDSLTVGEGDAAGTSYTVALATEPSGSVSVSITGQASTDLSLSGATLISDTLTFTVDDWNVAQTVTVKAGEDDDGANDTATLTHTASGGDYANITVDLPVTVTDDDMAGMTVQFGADAYTVSEGSTATITVTLSADPQSTVVIPLVTTDQGGAVPADYSVPPSVMFNTGEMSKTFDFTAMADDASDTGESVLLGFGTNLPGGVSAGTTAATTVTITDDDEPQGQEPGNVGRRGTVVTIERVPDGTVIPDHSSLWVGATVEDGSTFIEGTQALFRLKFEAVGGGPPVGTGVDVDLRFSWQIPSPLVTTHGQVGSASFSLHRVDVWDTAVWIHDNDVGHPDGTLTIRIIGCERSDCMIGTPSQITLTIADDDGGPEAAIPGPPDLPSLVCARSGDGYDDTGIAVSWKAPNFVGGAPVESYELRYRQSSRFVWGTLIEHPWESWPHGVAATSATLTGLVTRANYTVEVRAVSAIGPGQWSEPNYFRVGPTDEVCEIIDQLTPQPLNPPQPDSARQSLSNAPAQGEPRIDGIPEVGQTLSADTTAIADANGFDEGFFQYQWLAEDADIAGATSGTYTVAPGDVGKAIMVRVAFTDDARHEETLTSAPTAVVTAAGLQLQSATVDGATLTLTYNEALDTGVTLGTTPFAVSVNGSPRSLIGVGVGESNVLLLLSSAVEAGDTVTVDYTAPDGPDFIRGTQGRKAASFSGQAVTNNTASAPDETASAPLTASAHDAPSSHNGQDAFTFELRFSEEPKSDFSYTTVQDHAFTVTGGSVTYVRRLNPPSNIRWEITVTPGSGADVTIALNATTDCSAQGAICTEEGGKLSGGLLLVVPGPNAPATPNTPATDAPTISGTARVGETLTADTTGISDGDGLDNATFAYQWLADDAEINGATAATYTLAGDDAGKAIKVKVSFTDDAGNDEQLTSAVTGAVAAAPPPPNTPATGAPPSAARPGSARLSPPTQPA